MQRLFSTAAAKMSQQRVSASLISQQGTNL